MSHPLLDDAAPSCRGGGPACLHHAQKKGWVRRFCAMARRGQGFCGSVQSLPKLRPAHAPCCTPASSALPDPGPCSGRLAATERGLPCTGYRSSECLPPRGPLLSFDHSSSGLEKSQLPFKLTSLFSNPSWTGAGSPMQSPSQIFQASVASPHLTLSQAGLLACAGTLLTPTALFTPPSVILLVTVIRCPGGRIRVPPGEPMSAVASK